MRQVEEVVAWVVYTITPHGKHLPVNGICEQGEWDAMQAAQPGHYTLVRSGIGNEGEAERLARGTSGDRLSPRARRL